MFNSKLTAIIPVRYSYSNADNLRYMLLNAQKYEVQLIVVLDRLVNDESNSQIDLLVEEFGSTCTFKIGSFGSPGEARNVGLESFFLNKSKWLTFWDSDDVPLFDNISNSLSRLDLDHHAVLIGDFFIHNEFRHRKHLITTKSYEEFMLQSGLWRAILNMNLIEISYMFTSYPLGEDLIFLCSLDIPKKRYSYLQTPIYEYRIYSNSQSTRQKRKDEDYLEPLNWIKQNVKKLDNQEIAYRFEIRLLLTALKRTQKLKRKIEILFKIIAAIGLRPQLFLWMLKYIRTRRDFH